MKNVHNVLVCTLHENRSFGIRRRGWEDNIKIDVRGIGCDVMDRIELRE
jgi:hypothetical protein